jgi:uncharacterized protein YwgA
MIPSASAGTVEINEKMIRIKLAKAIFVLMAISLNYVKVHSKEYCITVYSLQIRRQHVEESSSGIIAKHNGQRGDCPAQQNTLDS